MHAKLTRDRKKKFIERMQKLIESLENHNSAMRNRLSDMVGVTNSHGESRTTPLPSSAQLIRNVIGNGHVNK